MMMKTGFMYNQNDANRLDQKISFLIDTLRKVWIKLNPRTFLCDYVSNTIFIESYWFWFKRRLVNAYKR
jgi:hypothetical protein